MIEALKEVGAELTENAEPLAVIPDELIEMKPRDPSDNTATRFIAFMAVLIILLNLKL